MGVSHAAFEASSHGLDQYRTEGLPVQPPPSPISAATISTITARWTAYFEAKMRLFEELLEPGGTAVVWTDDPKSDEVIARARRGGSRC
jgi:UDP-N-acetylmuramoyl-L-alanyl-D-glutamate--2,6-diaminopimelate ligase